ncbi:DMT family transporter [Vibrio pelagius]|uniref:DMT family transporter n=1 Tax=Vibrio pelagius TaxID=28169 RepID=UPI0021C3AED0|nr:DMT family transporter [Vibrio pelagius]
MLDKLSLSFLAVFSGLLLALMINVNSELGVATSAFQASWIAHGVGGIVAIFLYLIFRSRGRAHEKVAIKNRYWFGGIPGAFTVVLASITVQSEIGLTGTLALALIGQFALSLLIEHFALFDQPKVRLSLANLVPTLFVSVGALLIIYGKVGG